MKMNKMALSMAALLVSGSALAEMSANIGATSNYVWRGVTQTDDSAAFSGGLDYAHGSGLYVGVWASNVDFLDTSGGQAEVDLYAGFANELGSGLGYDVGVIYYAYPQADQPDDELDFTEVYASLSYGPFSGGVNYTVDKESDPKDENDLYYFVSAGTEFSDGWGLGGTVGHYDFDGSGAGSYSHAQLNVTKDIGDLGELTFSVSKVFDEDKLSLEQDALVFISWGKSFD